MAWKNTSVMEERIKFVAQALNSSVNFSRLCEIFGVSRPTGYRWLKRYAQTECFGGLAELSRRPQNSPGQTEVFLEERVVALRQRHGWGAKKLHVILARDERISLPVITIHRIIKRHGLIPCGRSHRPATKRFEAPSPNDLWQMDFKGEYSMKSGHCYPLSLLDDHSRYAVGLFALPSQRGEGVRGCLTKAFEENGVPESMLMDHGTPWWSSTNGHGLTWVAVWLMKQGIRLHFSGVRHPQTQGKVERFNRTLKDAVKVRGNASTLDEWGGLLSDIQAEYNHVRPHEALGMGVPASRYRPSRKPYNPAPPEWEYPEGGQVKRLNTQGCLDYGRNRYFVCEALAGEFVNIEQVGGRLLIIYRNTYVREIDTQTGKSFSLLHQQEKNYNV